MKLPVAAMLLIATLTPPALGAQAQQPRKFYVGADVSMLPEIERAGGVYREDGKPDDCLRILSNHGCNLFRIRLFVNPNPDFAKSHGATQDLPYVRELARRAKATGASFLLDLHYSDTWADPGKQIKPAAWKDLDFDALEQRVHDYTREVIADLVNHGAAPDLVQIGNEIASGILWPDGKVLSAKGDDERRQWGRFARLLNAGAKAVRESSTPSHPIQIMLHVHGGGRVGMAKWFFGEKLSRSPVDYDLVGLSFYPTWEDRLDALKDNLRDAIAITGKEVIVAEVSYPWQPVKDLRPAPGMQWPQSPEGQQQFIRDVAAAIKSAPENKAIGFIWWYPEAVRVKGLHIFRDGAEALFDDNVNPLPAMQAIKSIREGAP